MDGVFVSETEYSSRVCEDWHAHENDHISFILQGGNKECRRRTEMEITPGNMLFYNGGEWHRNVGTKHPSKNINLEIRPDFFAKYQLHPACFSLASSNGIDAKLALLRIFKECTLNDRQSIPAIHSLLLDVLTPSQDIHHARQRPAWARQVCQVLHDRWNENLTLTELSAAAGVHPVTVSKGFPKYFSCTLGEYTRKLRIDHAVSLVRRTTSSLTDIAHFCGFFDQSHFIKTFKKATGFLPAEYKKL